jgi:hypothetical protein
MIIDTCLREVDEPIVTVEMTLRQAEQVRDGLADLLCWHRGFAAANSNRCDDFSPMGVDVARELNIALKRAIEAAIKGD